jgi:hypothetical protein
MFNDVRWATNLLRLCVQILCMTLLYKILNLTFFLGFNLFHVCLLWFAFKSIMFASCAGFFFLLLVKPTLNKFDI